MNEQPQQVTASTTSRIGMGCGLGLIIGCPIGALGLLLSSILGRGIPLISVGFGLFGLLYVPLIGSVAGGIIGSIIGSALAGILAIHHPKQQG
jgi:hypothetical protein